MDHGNQLERRNNDAGYPAQFGGLGGLPMMLQQPQRGGGIVGGFFERIRREQDLGLARIQTGMIQEQRAQLEAYIDMGVMIATAQDRIADAHDMYRHNGVMRVLDEKEKEALILTLLAQAEGIKAETGLTLIETELTRLGLDLTREDINTRHLENEARGIENQLARLEMEIKTRSYQQNYAVR